jgi:cytochrome P450
MKSIDKARQLAMLAMMRAMLLRERIESGVSWSPIDRRLYEDPYPLYRRLREKDPVHRSRLDDLWILTRYDEINAVLRDPRFSADDRTVKGYEANRRKMIAAGLIEDREEVPSMLRMDPPDHTRLRSLVSKAFTPRAVESLRPRVEGLVREMLDEAESRGEMDIVTDLGVPLPIIVIAEMLGIPAEDREHFKRWSDGVARGLNANTMEQVRVAGAASKELEEYLRPIAEERRANPREDLLSSLLAAEEEGDKLSMDEVFATVILLLVAGNETTTNLIGNGMLALLEHPSELNRLRDQPDLIESAIEELLRWDSPVQATSRNAKEDLEFAGRKINKGAQLILHLGAANRDPAHFPEPNRLDIGRQENRHLSFSHGMHYCLGAPLARLESQVAIGQMVARFPNMRRKPVDLEWADNIILHGIKSLPVRLA